MLRNLAIRIVTYLCHRFNIALIAETRVANGIEAVARGQRWEVFYTEAGGLRDMITDLRRDYFTKVGEIKPGSEEVAMLKSLAMADKIAREVERKVQTVIETGRIRANDREHTNKIAAIRG